MESDNTNNKNVKPKASCSTEEFQAFITNLFEKNGVLNDLRAYLRGHIFTFLQTMHNGDMPECKKYVTQRLQFKYQAINVLLVEYLMKEKFGYSLSVFISEIPLANMTFDFTKSLYENSLNEDNLLFSRNDIFQILNYLGVHSDQRQILKILEDYQNHNEPLLMCILKNLTSGNLVCNTEGDYHSITSHNKKNNQQLKCEHHLLCETCQDYLYHLKEKSKKRKKHMAEKDLRSHYFANVNYVETKIKVIEEKFIEEMFEQLKNVYEGEINILREEDEKKVKRSIANHTSLMQKQQLELEKEMEARRLAMEAEFRKRKEFVEGLAATLKDAHEKLKDARHKMKKDAADLTNKEKSLKYQLQKAEETIKTKGEEMRNQISHELKLLGEKQQYLDREKNAIDREKQELENLKTLSETNLKLLTTFNMHERANLVENYDAMKNELDAIKKYIALCNESKANQDTLNKINNEINQRRVKVNHGVNDLKKMNNVNFSQAVSMSQKWYQDVTSYNRCDGTCSDTLKRLREEHEKLQEFSKQQSSHIELLSLSLRQINQTASSVSTNSATVPRETSRLPNSESEHVTLKDSKSKTLRVTRDLLKKKHKERLSERDKSSNIMIREAKIRLRKLEIEAEAVEKSYLKFRQRRAQENRLFFNVENNLDTFKIDTKDKMMKKDQNENQRNPEKNSTDCNDPDDPYEKIDQQTNLDFDKYLRKYHNGDKSTKLTTRLNQVDELKYQRNKYENKEQIGECHSLNYLETPLMEFRKLYQSGTSRAMSRKARYKQDKISSNGLQNNEQDHYETNTLKRNKSKETENTIDKCFAVKPNSTKTEIKVSGEEQGTGSELKVLNNLKVSEYDENSLAVIENGLKTSDDNVFKESNYLIVNKKMSASNNYQVNIDAKEPTINEAIAEATKDVEEIKSEKCNINEPNYFNDLAKEPENETTRENLDPIIVLEEKFEDSVSFDTSKDVSNLETKTSDPIISIKTSENVQIHDINADTANIDHANTVIEVDNAITIPPDSTPTSNIHANKNLSNPFATKNLYKNKVEESKSASLKEILINNSEDLNQEKPDEIENLSEAEYEDDFSIPNIDNSLSVNNDISPISILKSLKEENFWD